MMVEKECGRIENPIFPAIWELSSTGGTAKKSVIDHAIETDQAVTNKDHHRYRHRITGQGEQAPRPVRGGVLADVS